MDLIIGKPDLLEAKADFLDWLHYHKNYSSHTISAYDIDLTQFLKFLTIHHGKSFSLRELEELKITDFRAFAAYRRSLGNTARSLARNIAALRSFFRFLRDKKQVNLNSLTIIKSPKIPPNLPKILDINSTKQLVTAKQETKETKNWVEARDRAVLMLLYGAGLRISEALQLTSKDINKIKDGSLYIKGKGNKTRLVPILPVITEAIEQYRALCPFTLSSDDVIFFRGAKGGALHPNIIQKKVRELRRVLNLPENVTPHTLRHAFATHLLTNGANLRVIQSLLGHSSLSSTQIYVNLDTNSLLSIYSKSHPRHKTKAK